MSRHSTTLRLLLAYLVWVCLPALAVAQTGTIAPSPFLTALDNSGKFVNNGCIWTYSAGTTTAINTFTDQTLGTPNSNPIRTDSAGRFTAFLTPGTSYKFVYEQPCTPPAHGTVLRTADNIAATPVSSATVDVVGTAGETISAGQAVYLSDGSGSKVAGQWYKADTGNLYSSSTNVVGVATTAIASGSTGTIRLMGEVTGLTSLAPGTLYYVGAAGALSATPGGRLVGQADSTTSLASVAAPPPPLANNQVVCGRLTLTTATPVTTADVTGATTVYYTPYNCNRIALYDGSANWNLRSFAELSFAVPATTATIYDVFAYDNAGVVTLETLAWTNDTTRATALVLQNGVYVKTGATTRRYLGSFRTTAVSGQTENSAVKRYVWNYYNRVDLLLLRNEATASWTYTTATIRQANGAAANQVEVLVGVSEDPIDLNLNVLMSNSVGTIIAAGIGLDSTTTLSSGSALSTSAGFQTALITSLNSTARYPGIGRHFFSWNEWSTASGITTWYGAGLTLSGVNSGLVGRIKG